MLRQGLTGGLGRSAAALTFENLGDRNFYVGSGIITAERTFVLPGAGIDLANIRQFVAETGCTQVHMTAFCQRWDTSTLANCDIRFGDSSSPPESAVELTDRAYVRQVKELLLEM